MSRDNGLSMLDPNQITQEVHNETEKALDVITANSLIPKRFGKVDLEYVESSDGTCKAVGAVKYYSDGAYQEQTLTIHGDIQGISHKTILNFYNRTPQALANSYFTIYEDVGAVTVWFNLDTAGIAPSSPNRLIEVNISSGNTEEQLAIALNATINSDLSFSSVINTLMVMVFNNTVGIRQDSKDYNSGLVFKNIQGQEKQKLDGTYFLLNSSRNEDLYYVWYNINYLSLDPSISGRIGIEINISNGADISEVGYNTALTIAQTTKFITNIDEAKLTITNVSIGSATIIKDMNCKFGLTLNRLGSERELVAHLVMTYNVDNDLVSVERL